jgi:hypothetical protein
LIEAFARTSSDEAQALPVQADFQRVASRHTENLSGIFSDAHVVGKNDV